MSSLNIQFLYLPIETWSREYHAKVLLALHAVKNGWQVIIGPKSQMHRRLSRLPQGVVLQFGFHKNHSAEMKKIHEYGHKVVSGDEEGLVTLNSEHYKRFRVSKETLAQCDKCFCWGNVHAQMLCEVDPSIVSKLRVTGNPRMDLLKTEFRDLIEQEAKVLRKKYGRFILLNGNFGSFNHAMGIDYTFESIVSKGWAATPEDKDFHHRRIELQGRFFKAFQEVLPKIANQHRKVVVRPHPSESLVPWQQLSSAYPSTIIVVREGNIIPWLQASEVVLHNGCTTAVEAFVLGKPVISYRPEIISNLETKLPNEISIQVKSEKELIATLKDVAKEDLKTRKKRMDYAKKYFEFDNVPFACERMIESLPPAPIHSKSNFNSIHYWLDRAYFSARQIVGKIVYRNSSQYIGLKCSELDLDECKKTLGDYSLRINDNNSPIASHIGTGLIHIY